MRNLASSTEAQEVLQDHGRSTISKERYRQGVDMVLGKPASAGFFSPIENTITYFCGSGLARDE
jgi:hypothetical protein